MAAPIRGTRRTSLTLRFSIWTGAALLVTTTLSAYIGARQEERALLTQVERHAAQLADLLAADTREALFTFSVGDLENTVSAFARDRAVRFIEVRDPNGKLLKRHGDASKSAEMVVVRRDVQAANQTIGSVALGLSTDAAREAVADAWRLLIVRQLVILVLLFAVLAYLVQRVVSRPLADIADVMRSVADGGGVLTRRVEVTSHDEIGQLSRQFNEMADQLHTYHEALARRVAETAAKNAELDSFVSCVSHDLKAPLTTIRGFSAMLREHPGAQLDTEGQRYLARVETNARRMEQLIDDLLEFARIGHEAQPPEAVDVGELIETLESEMRSVIDARGVKIVVGDVGTLWGIRTQIAQVCRNLLSNAIKFTAESAAPQIEVDMVHRGAMWECRVRDNGIGIDAADHERIFEMFERADNVKIEGSGVGLAMVKKVVEAVGGRVWVESAHGAGATFFFTWPARG